MDGIANVTRGSGALAPVMDMRSPEAPAGERASRHALQQLEQALGAFAHQARWHEPEDPAAYSRAVLTIHQLMLALGACEAAGLSLDELRRLTEPVRQVYARSPFVHRLQTWPRGYPGDFESIDYVIDGVNRAPASDFAHHLEQYALWCAAAQQHRHKIARQASVCRGVLTRNRRARLLSIACGGSRDLATLTDLAPGFGGAIVLNDADPDALAVSGARLAPFGGHVHTRPGNALEIRTLAAADGPFDLVLAGGLFDYLPDGIAIRLIRTIVRDLVAPGGTFFFTNIADGNPYRLWMGVLGNWTLIERSEHAVRELFRRAAVGDVRLDLQRDVTGLAWLIEARR